MPRWHKALVQQSDRCLADASGWWADRDFRSYTASATQHSASSGRSFMSYIPRLSHSERGGWQIPVPWERAVLLHRRLDASGYPSSLRLNSESQDAYLELA